MKALTIGVWALVILQIPNAISAWHFNSCVNAQTPTVEYFPDMPRNVAGAVGVGYCNGKN